MQAEVQNLRKERMRQKEEQARQGDVIDDVQ